MFATNPGDKDAPGHTITLSYFKLVESLASLKRIRATLGETTHPEIPGVLTAIKTYALLAVANALNRNITQGQGTCLYMLRTVSKTCNFEILPAAVKQIVEAHWPDVFQTAVVPA